MTQITTQTTVAQQSLFDEWERLEERAPRKRNYPKRRQHIRRRKLTADMITVHNRSRKSITLNKWISQRVYAGGLNNMYLTERCIVFTVDGNHPGVSYMPSEARPDAPTAVVFSVDIVDTICECFGLGSGSHYFRVSEVPSSDPEIRLIFKLEEVMESQFVEEEQQENAEEPAAEEPATEEPATDAGEQVKETQVYDAEELRLAARMMADTIALSSIPGDWESEEARGLAARLYLYSRKDMVNAFVAGAMWVSQKDSNITIETE